MSTDPRAEQQALFYTQGSSDKEYRVELREAGAGLWMTLGFNGRRGSTLREQKKTPVPVDYATAKKTYDQVLNAKLKDGYTPDQSGAIYQSVDLADRFSGFVPQLLNRLREPDDLEAMLQDPGFVAQEKHDGERRPIRLSATRGVEGLNKEGVIVGLPVTVVDQVLALGVPSLLLDGEIMGERYVAFDLLEVGSQDLRDQPYAQRLERLTQLMATAGAPLELVETATTPAQKRALFSALKAHGAEGGVFKRTDAPYAPGRPASGGSQCKWPFVEVCSVRVSAHNRTKRSVAVEALADDGVGVVPLGNVTIPSNAAVPPVGAIVKVGYLYFYAGGSLFQPVYEGPRTDQSLPDRLAHFKRKSTHAFRAGPTLRHGTNQAATSAPAKRSGTNQAVPSPPAKRRGVTP